MVLPLLIFTVWCFVAIIGSLVASFILTLLSIFTEMKKKKTFASTRSKGLKSLPSAKDARVGGIGVKLQATTRSVPPQEEETEKENSDVSSDEENHHNHAIFQPTPPLQQENKTSASHPIENEEHTQTAPTTIPSPETSPSPPPPPPSSCSAVAFSPGMANSLYYKQGHIQHHHQCHGSGNYHEGESLYPAVHYPYLLPPKRKDDPRRLTVVLDLDETLVHSREEDAVPIELEFAASMGALDRLAIHCEDPEGGSPEKIMSFMRPGVFPFLRQLSTFAEVVVFTAGDPEYASPLVAYLDPECKTFVKSLYRNSTVRTVFHDHVKDLSRLGRDPRHTVLVDNNPFSFLFQPDNGVLCEPFFGDPSDQHLLQVVMPLLKLLACINDVRPILRRRYNLDGWRSTLPWHELFAMSQQN